MPLDAALLLWTIICELSTINTQKFVQLKKIRAIRVILFNSCNYKYASTPTTPHPLH